MKSCKKKKRDYRHSLHHDCTMRLPPLFLMPNNDSTSSLLVATLPQFGQLAELNLSMIIIVFYSFKHYAELLIQLYPLVNPFHNLGFFDHLERKTS